MACCPAMPTLSRLSTAQTVSASSTARCKEEPFSELFSRLKLSRCGVVLALRGVVLALLGEEDTVLELSAGDILPLPGLELVRRLDDPCC